MLKFKTWGIFDGTTRPYRAWLLTQPMPEIRLEAGQEVIESRRKSGEPRFEPYDKEAGEYLDRGTLDTWEITVLFNGVELPAWGPVGPFLAYYADTLRAPHKNAVAIAGGIAKLEDDEGVYPVVADPAKETVPLPDGVQRTLDALGLDRGILYALRVAIPEIDARPGDVLAWESGGGLSGVRGHVRQIDRSRYRAVAEVVEKAGAVVELFERRAWDTGLAGSLRKSAAHASRAKPETAPLYVLRPYSSPVSEPIEAPTDAHAVFELLQQVGGQ